MTKDQTNEAERELKAAAWMYDGPDGQHYIHEHRDVAHQQLIGWGWTETPLYTRPTDDLAVALERCEKTIENHFVAGNLVGLPGIYAIKAVLEDARAALSKLTGGE